MKPAFLSSPESGSRPDLGPQPQIDSLHDGAPGGRFFGSDLPVDSGGQHATTGGFSPEPSNPPLPTNPQDGVGKV